MVRAGLVVIVVVSVALLMMVMAANWLDAWPFPIGRSRDWWYMETITKWGLGGVLLLVSILLHPRVGFPEALEKFFTLARPAQ